MSAHTQPDAIHTPLAGAQRLARSRLAILAYLEHGHAKDAPAHGAQDAASSPAAATPWRSAREAVRRHWQEHPARLATELVAPLLSHWGRRHPLAFLGIAAAIGAALVMARPWKLISVTGVLVAALKSSNLASLALSALATRHTPPGDRGL